MQKTRVIAEIGVNHNGDVGIACDLVKACADLGADYAKFQIFKAAKLATSTVAKAGYQTSKTGAGSQIDMLKALELTNDEFVRIKDLCDNLKIAFLATPFDLDSARFLIEDLACDTVKIGSGDLDNLPLLLLVAASGVKMVVSTGMSTMGEIETAIDTICYGHLLFENGETPDMTGLFPSRDEMAAARAKLKADPGAFLTILHCTSEYPAAHPTLNMSAIPLLRTAFGLPVGFSDHSTDDVAAIMAVTLGATVLERHITYSKTAAGPDHAASLDIDEFRRMMNAIHLTEQAIGTGRKAPGAGEVEIRKIARKKIVAARPIRSGETITLDNVAFKRSPEGRPAGALFEVIGRKASRDFLADEPIL